MWFMNREPKPVWTCASPWIMQRSYVSLLRDRDTSHLYIYWFALHYSRPQRHRSQIGIKMLIIKLLSRYIKLFMKLALVSLKVGEASPAWSVLASVDTNRTRANKKRFPLNLICRQTHIDDRWFLWTESLETKICCWIQLFSSST